jgi:DNA-binding transcriptional ArsR family regulator
VKIVETFAEHFVHELSAPDISRMTGIVKTTVYRHVKALEKEGIVKKTRRVGNTQLYRLDKENDKARMIVYLETTIVSEELEEVIRSRRLSPIVEERRPKMRHQEVKAERAGQLSWFFEPEKPSILRPSERNLGPNVIMYGQVSREKAPPTGVVTDLDISTA